MHLCIGDARLPRSSKLEGEPGTCTLRLGRPVEERRINGSQLPRFILRNDGSGRSPTISRVRRGLLGGNLTRRDDVGNRL